MRKDYDSCMIFLTALKFLDQQYQVCQQVLHAPVVLYWLGIQGLLPKSALIKTWLTDRQPMAYRQTEL